MKKSKAQINEEKDIARLRKKMGLPPIKKGVKKCLKCDIEFYSRDFANERICENCKYNEERNREM